MNTEERLAAAEAQIAQLMDWMRERQVQAIPFPLDDASRNSLNVLSTEGTLSSGLTQNKNLSGNAETITVPAAYAGTLTLVSEGVKYKVPYTGTI